MRSVKASFGRAGELLYLGAKVIACTAVMAMIVLTFVDVLGRQFLSAVPGASEIISMLLGIAFYAGMSLVTRENAHIVVGILVERYPPALLKIETIVTRIVSALSMALIAWLILSQARKLLASRSLTEYLGLEIGYLVYAMAVLAIVATIWAIVRPRVAPRLGAQS